MADNLLQQPECQKPVALSIAGSDSSAGAGIQADLKTFEAHQVYGLTAVTAVTVQNTQGVYAVQEMPPEIVREQILCLFADMNIQAVKIGMVFNAGIIKAIARALEEVQARAVILDPVMISKSGFPLLQSEARQALLQDLMPLAHLITPNLLEARAILNKNIESLQDMEQAARDLLQSGPDRVVLKGGHLDSEQAVDVYYDGQVVEHLYSEYINTRNTHGTGCTFSAAIAAGLAQGASWSQAVHQAKNYIFQAIKHSLPLGRGHGPTNHFFFLKSAR